MPTRKIPLRTGEIYHIYNRGIDKRLIFTEPYESRRFLECLSVFNTREPVGSLWNTKYHEVNHEADPLVSILAYCLNPNHFHLLLRQVSEGGISEFMKRVVGGYTWFFNFKHQRSGGLMEGRFKHNHIDSNEYLLHASVYINLNDRVHDLSGPTA